MGRRERRSRGRLAVERLKALRTALEEVPLLLAARKNYGTGVLQGEGAK